ncbi:MULTISPECIES: hypothetical protein [Thalassospira]|jgi:hypothetical protein|uniref:DUF1828 domain-containing protein n=1 Tax=Thalassospira xiamenensis TaxID=220697 RepID=A0ABR5Y5E8_9PROT|nr:MULTISPECIES: hypothetical protein [Thalassospira]MBL4842220.1 hypothetical protein [Thalassospira sp.]MBR9782247.1 hypothetical protein [Rhodospirillales bacterium]KZD06380.1 hypothetical protein AUP40_10610 [Thalassospira xiamenensis]KZD07823.1 hypothetical protein AUP45_17995 [Thalassospira xiamenensis]MBR9815068.1 hypothetical protein [Rhodospirillales bacterium]|tara:strand:+ start:201 stop:947 length:747 start_codon:yes stop_codon:yes gene_type:complete
MTDRYLQISSEIVKARPVEHGTLVDTTCLLATGEIVQVLVSGGLNDVVVSDCGLAMTEIENLGAVEKFPSRRFKGYASKFGVNVSQKGELYLKTSAAEISAAVVLVANAVQEAVNTETFRMKPQHHRDLKIAVADFVREKDLLKFERDRTISGKHTAHKFEHVFESRNNRLIILDTVVPDLTSISSRVVAHIDVRENSEIKAESLLVYDETDSWRTDRLGLLELAGTIVPFDRLDEAMAVRFGLETTH